MLASCDNCNELLTSRRNRAWRLCDDCLGKQYAETLAEEGYSPESLATTI